jgi:hypothetical protein
MEPITIIMVFIVNPGMKRNTPPIIIVEIVRGIELPEFETNNFAIFTNDEESIN